MMRHEHSSAYEEYGSSKVHNLSNCVGATQTIQAEAEAAVTIENHSAGQDLHSHSPSADLPDADGIGDPVGWRVDGSLFMSLGKALDAKKINDMSPFTHILNGEFASKLSRPTR